MTDLDHDTVLIADPEWIPSARVRPRMTVDGGSAVRGLLLGLALVSLGCAGSPSQGGAAPSSRAVTPSPAAVDLTLRSLTLGGKALSAAGTAYAAAVPSSAGSVAVVAVTSEPSVSVAFGTAAYTKGTATADLTLQPGLNTFAVRLLGPDGRSARYSLAITRAD